MNNFTLRFTTASCFKNIFALLVLFLLSFSSFGQNALVGAGFSTGWGGGSCPTGNANFKYLASSAGTSYGVTTVANGTGSQYFRFGVDWSGTTSQLAITPGVDTSITPNTTYSLNTSCTTSGSQVINVTNASYNYVFKTLNAGTAPTGTFTFFEVQGAVRSVTSVSQLPLSGSVTPSSATTITANLDGALSTGQAVYLRYTNNAYSTSTVVQMTGSGTTYTGVIPAGTNTAAANVSYYIFTSGTANVASNGSNADLYTINLNNNAGSNYNYTVTTPVAIYAHNFGTTTITTHPYTVAPGTFAANLSSSSWTNSANSWTSFAGSAGQAIANSSVSAANTWTLTFNVAIGNSVSVSSFSFWRQSSQATNTWSMTINGISAGSGTIPTTGAVNTVNPVANPITGLTGTVTVVITFGGTLTGSMRIDDFTLNGNVVVTPVSPPVVTAASPTGTYNTPFSYNIVASNSPTSYAIASGSLPTGLTLNTTTGAITGTPTAAGSFTANVTATNSGGTSSPAALNFTIAKANQTITFAALTPVTYGIAPYALTGTASSGLTVTYASSNTAVATISGSTITIVGAGSTNITASQIGDTNYNLATNVVRALTVNPKALTISGITANNKVQDGNTTATLSGTPTLVGVVAADLGNVSVSGTATATFASSSVGTGIAVSVSGYTLSGTAAGNYTVSQPTGLTADITGLSAPVAIAATGVLQTQFDANWNTVASANNGYLLDVSTSPTFGTTVVNTNTTIINNTGTTGAIGWTETTVSQQGGGSPYLGLLASTSTLITPAFDLTSFSNINLDFLIRTFNGTSGSSNVLTVSISTNNGSSWTTLATRTAANNTLTAVSPFNLDAYTAYNQVKIRFQSLSATGSIGLGIDDITIIGDQTVITPSFVSGYNAKPIAGQATITSLVNTLTADTQYYYRLRAKNGTAESPNSNVIAVKTKPVSCTWDGTAWSNTTGPDSDIEAIIAGAYSTTSNGVFTAKKVTVNSGSLTVNSGTNITIVNELVNNLTGNDVVVENNANLLQINDVANTGSIKVRRNSSSIMRQDYTLWSAPVAGQNLLAFSPNTLTTRFYTYNTTTNLYNAVTPSTTSFAYGTGYLIRTPNNFPTTPTVWPGSFTGVPNNGSNSVALTNVAAGQRFNAIGNPYPSPIDMFQFVADNSSNITGSLYFWRKTNSIATSPGYCTWTGGTFVSNGEAGVFDPNDVLRTGQGFIVEATATGSSVAFNNGQRIADNANQFFRNASNVDVIERNRMWFNLTNTAGAFSQTAVGYVTGASQNEDAFDGKYFNNGEVSLTTKINAVDYAIQSRALPFNDSDIVPLSYSVTNAGQYSITLDHKDGLFADGSQDIFLKDNLLNTYTNMNSGSYTFTSEIGSFDNRFEIVYVNGTLGIDTPTLTSNQVVIYKNNTDTVINSGAIEMASIKVFDLRGRLLIEKNNINSSETKVNLGTTNQIVLVQIISIDGQIVTKKTTN